MQLLCDHAEDGTLYPEEISAYIVAELLSAGEEATGCQITKAVISVISCLINKFPGSHNHAVWQNVSALANQSSSFVDALSMPSFATLCRSQLILGLNSGRPPFKQAGWRDWRLSSSSGISTPAVARGPWQCPEHGDLSPVVCTLMIDLIIDEYIFGSGSLWRLHWHMG